MHSLRVLATTLATLLPLASSINVINFRGAVDYNLSHLTSLVGNELELTHIMFFNTTDLATIELQLASVDLPGLFSHPSTTALKRNTGESKVDCHKKNKVQISKSNVDKYKVQICSALTASVVSGGTVGAVIVQGLVCTDRRNGHATSICSLGVLGSITFAGTLAGINVQALCTDALTDVWDHCGENGGKSAAVIPASGLGLRSAEADKGNGIFILDAVEYETVKDCSNDNLDSKVCEVIHVHG